MASKVWVNSIKAIQETEDRQVVLFVECAVRGDVAIVLSEDDARWIRADLAGKVSRWEEQDGERNDD